MAWEVPNIIINLEKKIKEIGSSIPGPATTDKAGVVKPDGSSITVTSDGTISAAIATTSSAGIVKPDGSSITVASDGTISTQGSRTETASGGMIEIEDHVAGAALIEKVYGMSTQDGTPTPASPVNITSALANWSVTDGTATATITSGITLRAIEVTESDDYNLTIDDKYYVADTIDWTGTGYAVTRRIASVDLGAFNWQAQSNNVGDNRFLSSEIKPNIIAPPNTNTKAYALCSKYSIIAANDTWIGSNYGISVHSNKDVIILDQNTLTGYDAAAFKEYVDGTIFNYIYSTPTTSSLSDEETEALLSLRLYDEDTTITPTSTPAVPKTVIEYPMDRVAAIALTAHNKAFS